MRPEYDLSKGKRRAVIPQRGKTRITLHIDNAVLEAFRALAAKKGTGCQTMMNEALRRYLDQSAQPLTKLGLREVIREEMPQVLRELTIRPGTRTKG